MAAAQRNHFADPHALMKTEYSSWANQKCQICTSKLAGLIGYRCNACDFNIHEGCADSFQKTITFFGHKEHTLTLSPVDNNGHKCILCQEQCKKKHFVYRCIRCDFDVHPLCTLVPPTIQRHPMHPEHDLRMVSDSGGRKWRYQCDSCDFKLAVKRVSGGAQAGSATGILNTVGKVCFQLALHTVAVSLGIPMLDVLVELF